MRDGPATNGTMQLDILTIQERTKTNTTKLLYNKAKTIYTVTVLFHYSLSIELFIWESFFKTLTQHFSSLTEPHKDSVRRERKAQPAPFTSSQSSFIHSIPKNIHRVMRSSIMKPLHHNSLPQLHFTISFFTLIDDVAEKRELLQRSLLQ